MRASVFFAVNFVLTFVIVTPNIWLEINGQDVIGIILFASHDIYSIITSYIFVVLCQVFFCHDKVTSKVHPFL